MNIESDKYRYGFFNYGAGIGDGIIKTSIPENFFPIEGLDFPNNPARPDIKLDWWLT